MSRSVADGGLPDGSTTQLSASCRRGNDADCRLPDGIDGEDDELPKCREPVTMAWQSTMARGCLIKPTVDD